MQERRFTNTSTRYLRTALRRCTNLLQTGATGFILALCNLEPQSKDEKESHLVPVHRPIVPNTLLNFTGVSANDLTG